MTICATSLGLVEELGFKGCEVLIIDTEGFDVEILCHGRCENLVNWMGKPWGINPMEYIYIAYLQLYMELP